MSKRETYVDLRPVNRRVQLAWFSVALAVAVLVAIRWRG